MNSKKVFYILLGFLGFIVIAGGYGAYVFNASLIAKSNELQALKLENYAKNLEQQATWRSLELLETYKDVPELSASIVPQDKNQARTILELSQIANENDITLNGFTFPGSTLGTNKPKPAGTASGTAIPQPESQLEAVPGLPGVFSLKVGTGSANPVPFSVLINFLDDLENNRRTAQVSSLSITPDPVTPGSVTFNLQLTLYIKP